MHTCMLSCYHDIVYNILTLKLLAKTLRLLCFLFTGDSQPDVNITSPKVLSIPEFNPLVIFCNADVARFPSESPPEPPTKIIIQIGTYKVKECENGGLPVKECFYYLGSYFPALPRTINCTAVNALGECRFKTSEIQLLSSSGLLIIWFLLQF